MLQCVVFFLNLFQQRVRQTERSRLRNSPNSDNVVEYVWICFKWWLPRQLYLIVWQLLGVEELRRCVWSWDAGERLSNNITQTGVWPIINTEIDEWYKYICSGQIRTSDGSSGTCQRETEYCPEIKKLVSCNDSVVCAPQSWWETWVSRGIRYLWCNSISMNWNREM